MCQPCSVPLVKVKADLQTPKPANRESKRLQISTSQNKTVKVTAPNRPEAQILKPDLRKTIPLSFGRPNAETSQLPICGARGQAITSSSSVTEGKQTHHEMPNSDIAQPLPQRKPRSARAHYSDLGTCETGKAANECSNTDPSVEHVHNDGSRERDSRDREPPDKQ